MKKFSIVYLFELKGYLKSKPFIIATAIICILSIGGFAVNSLISGMISDSTNSSTVEKNDSIIVVKNDSTLNDKELDYLQNTFPESTFHYVASTQEIETQVKDEQAIFGFEVTPNLDFSYYVKDAGVFDNNANTLKDSLSQLKFNMNLTKQGINPEEVYKITNEATVTGTDVILGQDLSGNYIYVIVLFFMLYMCIIMYGQITATSVASEKGNRTMELLVTSCDSTTLIFSKVLAGATSALIQMLSIFLSVFIGFQVFMSGTQIAEYFKMSPMVLIGFIAFGLLGFIFYLFIFGALGALVSKSEDVNSSATPITMIFMVVYFVGFIGIMNPDGLVLTIASYVPFSSPMAMFARMALVDVPMYEVVISFLILVASTLLVGVLAARIYRRGTLMYGNQVKLIHALRWIKKTT